MIADHFATTAIYVSTILMAGASAGTIILLGVQTLQQNGRLSHLRRTGFDIITAIAFALYVATFWAALTVQPDIIFNPAWLPAQALLGALLIPALTVYVSRIQATRTSGQAAKNMTVDGAK